ncbi:MAG: hypothetical protein ACKOD0_04755, partial [Actinomycetota bacterium]
MTTYRELLAQVKTEIEEIEAAALADELDGATPPLLVDAQLSTMRASVSRAAATNRDARNPRGMWSAGGLAPCSDAAGDGAAAQATLAAVDHPRAAVASALAGYDPADPDAAIDRLRGLAD